MTDQSMRHLTRFIFLLFSAMWLSCATGKLYINGENDALNSQQAEQPIYTLYAIGDAGEQNDQAAAVLHGLVDVTADDTQAHRRNFESLVAHDDVVCRIELTLILRSIL